MIKKAFIPILLLINFFSYSQDSVLEVTQDEKEPQYNYNKIMLIPYNPSKAFLAQDGTDRQIAQYSKENLEEIRRRFQFGLNQEVYFKMLARYDSKDMLLDQSNEGKKDLQTLNRIVSYKYETPYSIKDTDTEEEKTGFFDRIKNKFIKPEQLETDDPNTTSKFKVPEKQIEYMNVHVQNNEIFQYLNEKYGTDLFVFINMFEIKTDYENCVDLQSKRYGRELTVHFSIFDKTGKQIYGDKVSVQYDSSTNDITEIIKSNFPLVADYMTWNLPERKKM